VDPEALVGGDGNKPVVSIGLQPRSAEPQPAGGELLLLKLAVTVQALVTAPVLKVLPERLPPQVLLEAPASV
jgi:hypothetical protein